MRFPEKLGKYDGRIVLLDPQSAERTRPITAAETRENFELGMRSSGFEKSDKYSDYEV